MEMFKINDNTIRVILDKEDIAARGIEVLDILGNQKKLEDFFYSILGEVDMDEDFKENDAVTFQIIPRENDGVEMIITKILNEDEIPGNFGQFNDGDESQDQGQEISDAEDTNDTSDADDFKENVRSLFEMLNDEGVQTKQVGSQKHSEFDDEEQLIKDEHYVVEFDNFEDFISLAQRLYITNGEEVLFNYKDKYYLEVTLSKRYYPKSEMMNIKAITFEYGKETKVSPALLKEHGKLIIRSEALQTARYYFKK